MQFKYFYRKFSKLQNFLKYNLTEKMDNLIVILTFDDAIKEEYIKIPEYLGDKDIKATFFIPPGKTEGQYIQQIASLGHEIGGHGYNHEESEAQDDYRDAAEKCHAELEKFFSPVTSWRFPGLRISEKGLENVKKAGFKVDSTRGTYYPIQSAKSERDLYEYPFLRIPPEGQMDIDVNEYDEIKDFILDRVLSWRGIVVIPFHTKFQSKHFEKFKDLIGSMKENGTKFKTLLDIHRKKKPDGSD